MYVYKSNISAYLSNNLTERKRVQRNVLSKKRIKALTDMSHAI